jgi:hypothetical protein
MPQSGKLEISNYGAAYAGSLLDLDSTEVPNAAAYVRSGGAVFVARDAKPDDLSSELIRRGVIGRNDDHGLLIGVPEAPKKSAAIQLWSYRKGRNSEEATATTIRVLSKDSSVPIENLRSKI